MAPKATRSTKGKSANSSKPKPKAAPSKKARLDSPADDSADNAPSESSDDDDVSAYDNESEEEEADEGKNEVIEVNSDLEEEDEDEEDDVVPVKKRKSTGGGSASKADTKKKVTDDGGRNTRVVAKVLKVPAPKVNAETHIILPSTFEFLRELAENNETREWFWENEARYRHVQTNWNTFISKLVPIASEADWTIPHMPAKDLVHRISRDVRFSNNKTPYKTNIAASFSRTGRKGIFALYYIQVQPGDKSIMAAGIWQPSSAELATIRQAILADPAPLRKAISDPEFIELFGEPKAVPGIRSNVFGNSDELKNCPKLAGVTKEHPDIDLLKLRSIAVSKRLTDAEVLADDFTENLGKLIKVLFPFVHTINEMLVPTPPDDEE